MTQAPSFSSSQVGQKASTICLYQDLSCASCCASLHVRFISFSAAVTVGRQVVLGRPFLLFPGGVHPRATFGIRLWAILNTMPQPAKSAAFDLQHNTVALGHLVQLFVWDSLWPEDAADFPEALIVKGIDLPHVTCCDSPAFQSI